jgi:hypothetical protein
MKKAIQLFVILFVLLIGSTKLAHAVQQECYTLYFSCNDGTGGYGMVCGASFEELVANSAEMQSVICGTQP